MNAGAEMTDDPIVQAAAEALVNDIRAEHGLPPCNLSLLTEPDMIAYRVRAAAVVASVTPLIRTQIADQIAGDFDGYLHSPSLDQMWIAGWHSATSHHIHRIKQGGQQ